MKKEYIKPFIILEHFNADEYVAACVVGTIQCAIPGTYSHYGRLIIESIDENRPNHS